jgi:hypothetical protein
MVGGGLQLLRVVGINGSCPSPVLLCVLSPSPGDLVFIVDLVSPP